MRFLYVFALMFLSVFGLVVLLKYLFCALLDGNTRRFDVFVRDEENIEEFLQNARKCSFIGRIIVITDKSGEELASLSEKYADVGFVGEKNGEKIERGY